MRLENETWFTNKPEPQSYLLVGDSFKAQVSDPRLISVSELEALLTWVSGHRNTVSSLLILPGQGVSDKKLEIIESSIKILGLDQQISIHPSSFEKHAAPEITHKHVNSNILITEPSPKDDGYFARLKIDESCDDIRDHLTGKHLPGMLLTEAARQMVLAVSEKFIVSPADIGHATYITHKQTMEFKAFLFPIGVDIHAKIVKLRRTGKVNFQAVIRIDFLQGSVYAVNSEFSFSGFDQRIIQQQETRQAMAAIERNLRQIPVEAPVQANHREELAS